MWAFDIEESCISTVIANFAFKVNAIQADIRGLPSNAFDRVDLIICGIPCQPFTRIGRRKKEADERDISSSVAREIKKLMPKWIIFENVREYKNSIGFEILNEILVPHYNLNWKELNFADYGIPQRRHRLIGLGNIYNPPVFPNPTHTKQPTLMNNLSPGKLFGEIRDRNGMPPLSVTAIRGLLRRYGNHREKGNGFSIQIIDDNDVMFTVLGTMYRGSGTSSHCNLIWEEGRIRNVSILEARRAQGFPDNYIFVGTIPRQWQMIANTLPPDLTKILIQSLTRRQT